MEEFKQEIQEFVRIGFECVPWDGGAGGYIVLSCVAALLSRHHRRRRGGSGDPLRYHPSMNCYMALSRDFTPSRNSCSACVNRFWVGLTCSMRMKMRVLGRNAKGL